MHTIKISTFGEELINFDKFFDKFYLCLFYENISPISILKYFTDLTGSRTKLLSLILETVCWCCLTEQNKINWVFDLFNERLLAASDKSF